MNYTKILLRSTLLLSYPPKIYVVTLPSPWVFMARANSGCLSFCSGVISHLWTWTLGQTPNRSNGGIPTKLYDVEVWQWSRFTEAAFRIGTWWKVGFERMYSSITVISGKVWCNCWDDWTITKSFILASPRFLFGSFIIATIMSCVFWHLAPVSKLIILHITAPAQNSPEWQPKLHGSTKILHPDNGKLFTPFVYFIITLQC